MLNQYLTDTYQFPVSLLLPFIWKFLTKYGNINSIFHSDKISADNTCRNRFVSEILSFSKKI